MDLLPYPRRLERYSGWFSFPARPVVHLEPALPPDTVLLPMAVRLQAAAKATGVELEVVTGPSAHPRLAIRVVRRLSAPNHSEGYRLAIGAQGIALEYRQEPGLRAGVATLRQLLSQYGRRLPKVLIEDYPDFPRRGVMLDVSRGRVPNLATLLDLADHLADFKVNELQLYTEHTFAYRDFEPVWRDWGALTGEDILVLDAHCRQLGIDLVPNQNSFGHLRYWLEYPVVKELAEVREPYEGTDGTFVRYPTTLAPTHPGTLRFLRGLYDELLPHFSSARFNVGCDETWDLGRGQSRRLCQAKGKGRVYLAFLKKIHREVRARGRSMQFWGDIVLHHPELIRHLPRELVALNWGYEADHPFDREAAAFAEAEIPFYVCPGTSSWMTLVGRHDNAFANLQLAAKAGLKHGAVGFLNTDWGDGGHPQPLAVSWFPYAVGAAVSWCAKSFDPRQLVPALSRHIFEDDTQEIARAALTLGVAHRQFDYFAPNVTPFGAVIAAPIPKTREIPCRDGLKYYARIREKNILAALDEVQSQRRALRRGHPQGQVSRILALELELAARMAAESCHIMLWQKALAAGRNARARVMARRGISELRALNHDFNQYWGLRNKGTTRKCSAFLLWRVADYQKGKLHFPPEIATAPKGTRQSVE